MRTVGDRNAKHRLIFGCGYLGERVARLWLARGDCVSAVTRSASRPSEWRAKGLPLWSVEADVTRPETLHGLRDPAAGGWLPGPAGNLDTVLFAVGYDRTAGPSIREVYAGGFRNVLDRLSGVAGRVIYISTTGVYGDAGGEWVDEQTPPRPTRPGGVASLAAEEALFGSRFADRGVALRLAGIYGPGRAPMAEKLRRGEPIAVAGEGPLNLIHVDDAAAVVAAAADAAGPLPRVLCVSDGNPPTRADYYREVARLVGAPAPRFAPPPADSPSAARSAASKRVSPRRMLRELGVELRYPDYRRGLAAILGSGVGGE